MKKKVKFEPSSSCLETVQRLIRRHAIDGYHIYIKEIDHNKGIATIVYTQNIGYYKDDNSETN